MNRLLAHQRVSRGERKTNTARTREIVSEPVETIRPVFAATRRYSGLALVLAGTLLVAIFAVTIIRPAVTTADATVPPATDRNGTAIPAAFELPEITIAGSDTDSANEPTAEPDSDGEIAASGSGLLGVNREEDYDHPVSRGETLSEIAWLYQIDTPKLAAYNGIANIHEIRAGDIIRIPSIAKERQIAQQQSIAKVQIATSVPTTGPSHLPELIITAKEQYDGRSVTAHFFIQAPKELQLTAFEWDLGNRQKSFRAETYWTYDLPGTYRVSLKARVANGTLIKSNEILIDVPHPTTYRAEYQSFITLSSVREQFALQGELIGVLNYRDLQSAPIEAVASNFDTTIYRFTKSGYYSMTIEHEGVRSTVYVFVSPLESVHVDRTELNWYRTQFNTGAQSNCGPSTVSMAVAWAKGDYVPVSTIRQQVGWHEERLGATTLEELYSALRKNDVNVRYRRLYSKTELINVIDSGNVAIVLFETGDIPDVQGHPLQTPFGRYYTYTQGHYIIVKGYTTDRNYFIVHDPIPSDWGSNSLRYQDGISMIGRNRYYPADTLVRSIRSKRSDFLEIWR